MEIPLDTAMEMPVDDGCGAIPFAGSLGEETDRIAFYQKFVAEGRD